MEAFFNITNRINLITFAPLMPNRHLLFAECGL